MGALIVGSIALFVAGIEFERTRFKSTFLLLLIATYFLIAAIGNLA